MKITFLLPSTNLVGGVRVIFEYANRLRKRGHNVNIVYPLVPFDITPKLKMMKIVSQAYITLVNLKQAKKISWFDLKTPLIQVPTINPKYLKYFEELIPDADVVVATSYETAYTVNALNSKKGTKFYFVQHYEIWDIWNNENCWEEIERNPDKNSLSMADVTPKEKNLKIFKNLVDTTYKLPLKKITISTWLKQIIEQKLGSRVEDVIINGTNFEIFYKENLLSENTKIRIAMPYRPINWKGAGDGIKALEMVKKRYPEIEFILYGSKNMKNYPEWINHRGKVSDEELRELYNTTDIFIYPSWVEGFGLPPMEAMACGCAVVTTDVGAISDYSINGKTVLVVPPRNPEILALNIIRLIENEDERNLIAENAHSYVSKFTWEKATDKLEKCFADSLK